jgi:hypothetical protein
LCDKKFTSIYNLRDHVDRLDLDYALHNIEIPRVYHKSGLIYVTVSLYVCAARIYAYRLIRISFSF